MELGQLIISKDGVVKSREGKKQSIQVWRAISLMIQKACLEWTRTLSINEAHCQLVADGHGGIHVVWVVE